MDGVYELEFIGRGGQGGKTAAEMVARYAIRHGKLAQSFPDYGPERKGAPVRAFTRISEHEIRGCSSEANPDVLVIIDPSLMSLNGTLFSQKKGQTIIINSPESPDSLKKSLSLECDVHSVDATKIALEVLDSRITNTTMLGAFAKITGFMSLDDIKIEIKEEFGRKLDEDTLKKNYQLTERAFNEVR